MLSPLDTVYVTDYGTNLPLSSPIRPQLPSLRRKDGKDWSCVIGSDVGGIRELIEDGEAGLLFRADSRESLEQEILLSVRGCVNVSVLGQKARAHVIAHRQRRHMAQAYEAAYRTALRSPQRTSVQ